MTTSSVPGPRRERGPSTAYVWTWLPGATAPVVCGRLDRSELDDDRLLFTYARSYLDNARAISLYTPELPLERGTRSCLAGKVHGCIADGGPDSWGKRVILRRRNDARDVDEGDLGPLTCLLESASDRVGALDFQSSPTEYVARGTEHPGLSDLEEAAERVVRGEPVPDELRSALLHGTSAGGARPKAMLSDGSRQFIAKFSVSSDVLPTVKAEFVAMELARRAGINTAPVRYVRANGRDVLLVERFDRPGGDTRRAVLSVRTILRASDPRGVPSYAGLVDAVRVGFTEPERTIHELFSRIVFNILCGNDDDHARNHAAFWDGRLLSLTPAFDLCPQVTDATAGSQAMAIGRDGYRRSRVDGCVARAGEYLLSTAAAKELVARQIDTVHAAWDEVCDMAELTRGERAQLLGRQFLRPDAIEAAL